MGLYEKIKLLAEERKISIRKLEYDLGYGNGTIRRWETNSPGIDKVEKIADYFDVSTDYLLGRTENGFNKTKKDLYDLEEMLNSNVNMAFGGENLTDAEKQRVKDILTGLFWEERENKK